VRIRSSAMNGYGGLADLLKPDRGGITARGVNDAMAAQHAAAKRVIQPLGKNIQTDLRDLSRIEISFYNVIGSIAHVAVHSPFLIQPCQPQPAYFSDGLSGL